MSTMPMMVITQGKPMVSAMDPPIDGPGSGTNKAGWFDFHATVMKQQQPEVFIDSLMYLFSLEFS